MDLARLSIPTTGLEFVGLGNEAYLVRAFLKYNETFEILSFNNFPGSPISGRRQAVGTKVYAEKRSITFG